jgi:hypothetical protein
MRSRRGSERRKAEAQEPQEKGHQNFERKVFVEKRAKLRAREPW